MFIGLTNTIHSLERQIFILIFIAFIGLTANQKSRKPVAPQSELRRLGTLKLKLELVRNQGDEFRIGEAGKCTEMVFTLTICRGEQTVY